MTDISGESSIRFRLVGVSKCVKGCIWPIDGGTFTLGRSASCDVRLPEPHVSRVHCEITRRNGGLYCENCSSSGVILINGRPTENAMLNPGDELTIDGYAFVLAKSSFFSVEDESASEISTAPHDYAPALGSEDTEILQTFPGNVRDVYLLLKLCRDAAACADLNEIFALIISSVRHRFSAVRVWFAQHVLDGGRYVTPEALRDELDNFADAPVEEITRIHSAEKTACLPASRENGDRSLVICPISLSDTQKYVLAFETPALESKAREEVTLFCGILSYQIAPIASAVDANSISRRSLELIRQNSAVGEEFKGQSKSAQAVRKLALKAASTNLPVLVLGETGVGKEIVARSIHSKSHRASGPFVVCNCPAVPSSLFESEVFGHVKGAFTGADADRRGLFEQANGGTVFLDEVGDLGLEQQSKILRVLETGLIRPVGGSQDIAVDMRVVAATNDRLIDAVSAGRFREDLFHRLSGIEIAIPPLRARRSDIPSLAQHFLMECAAVTGGPVRTLSEPAVRALTEYDWPGNVRELRQVIGRSYALADNDLLEVGDVFFGSRACVAKRKQESIKPLASVEQEHIAAVLSFVSGNKSKAADLLGIGRDTLRRKIRLYGLPY